MDIEQTVRAAFVLREPAPDFEDVVMARVSGVARRMSRGKPKRRILFGTLLVVAAAAAVLLARLTQPSAPVAALVAPPALPVATVAEAVALAEPVVVEPQPAQAVAPEETATPVQPFTVQVLPLVNEATEPSASAAIQTVYATFVEQLRAVPGVTLLQLEQGEGASQVHPDFRITLRGAGKVGMFGGDIQTEALDPDGTQRSNSYLSFSGDVAPPCASTRSVNAIEADVAACRDARGVGADLIMRLRTMAFPPDPSLRRSLQARLANPSMAANLRWQALFDLGMLGQFRSLGSTGPNEALRDPAVLRAAVELATTAADPLVRAQVWARLRGVGNAELARPLLAALRQDRDGEVRLAALGTLVAGFREDERFDQALETAAERDARPLVRALAQRVLAGAAGEAAWRDYIADSLKDAKRSGAERIEALFYQLGLPATAANISGMRDTHLAQTTLRQLDGEAIQALVEALSEAAPKSSVIRQYASFLMNDLDQLENPAITELLLASLDDDSSWLERGGAVYGLGLLPSRRNDPRVRAVLEKISVSDPDPRVRQVAATALQQPAVPVVANATQAGAAAWATGTGQPPRLGIGVGVVEAGSFAPKELVGKTQVANVWPGSVAEKAGMLGGDVLLEINGTPLQSPAAIPGILASLPRGVDVELLVNRRGENVKLKARF